MAPASKPAAAPADALRPGARAALLVQFWDANATKALHVGHLRNLAIGNAVASALAQAGGQVERRSLISDAGRSMGEAMAGVRQRAQLARRQREERPLRRHCYADYVAATAILAAGGEDGEFPEDSLTCAS